jgi:hypothetical protein
MKIVNIDINEIPKRRRRSADFTDRIRNLITYFMKSSGSSCDVTEFEGKKIQYVYSTYTRIAQSLYRGKVSVIRRDNRIFLVKD